MDAFKHAIAHCTDLIELDVLLTRDQHVSGGILFLARQYLYDISPHVIHVCTIGCSGPR